MDPGLPTMSKYRWTTHYAGRRAVHFCNARSKLGLLCYWYILAIHYQVHVCFTADPMRLYAVILILLVWIPLGPDIGLRDIY